MDVSEGRKPKLKSIERNVHLKISQSIIYYMGTWPPRGKKRYFYLVYTVSCFTFMLGIFLATEIANFVLSLGDMAKIVAGATILMTNCTHAYKKRIQKLLDITRNETFNQSDDKYESIYTRYAWQGIYHHIAYQSFGTMAVLSWGFTPITDLLAGRSRQLPMEGWYPYNVTETPAFEITSSHQVVALIIACFHNVAMDTLITGLITVACCQLTLLSLELSSIDNEIEHGKMLKNSSKPYEQLKHCVEHSNMIFDFSTEIQDIFGTVIFLQFLVNCIIICLIAFNLTQMKVYIPSVLFGLSMYMCCMTYQIFIYCWHGNELHLHSANVLLAAYSSNWWHGSKRFKRGVYIIMARAARPLVISAGNIMTLSLQTFVKILRMSYSIFTVLESSTEA